MATYTGTIEQRIILAAQMLDTGEPPDGMVPTQYVFPSIAEEREQHEEQARAHATEQTGYTWAMDTMLTDAAEAWEIIRGAEYGRLEAAARERRILALAASLEGATLVA